MRGLRFLGNKNLELTDLPDSKVGEGDVLVRVKTSAICGSEMETFIPPEPLAGNPGHEVMGEVEDPNASKRFRKGDRVGISTVQGCGNCFWCRQGKQIFCKEAGVLKNAHSEYVVSKEVWLHPLADDIDNATAVLLSGDGMGVPYGSTIRSGVTSGDTTCVFGAGPVGLGMTLLQTYLGARVIAVDINPHALERATQVGAWKTINPKETEDLRAVLLDLTNGLGPGKSFDACGDQEMFNVALETTMPGGTVVTVAHGGHGIDSVRERLSFHVNPAKWEIPAVIVTNKTIPDDKKQIAMITLARHGQERGARVVGPEILNYLASDEAVETRDKQIVIVVPVFNPEGVVLDEFHSTMFGITDHEKKIMGNLCADDSPDMLIDYHSLGMLDGSKYDHGDMEAIIPANSTKWGMDEQIYQQVANKMLQAAEAKGFPYEIHTLEDLAFYYFGEADTGRLPWKYQKEKVFLLNVQNFYEHYDAPERLPGYTNYTCGPAYLKWHTLVFGMETNHWSITSPADIAESGLLPCQALLTIGNKRSSWEKDPGYPTNLICGDFRVSIRAIGNTPGERRVSRERIWHARNNFNILERELVDPETTLAKVGYLGGNLPLEFAFCLRMRENVIRKVLVEDQEVNFEIFKDHCSTFLYIPMSIKKAGVSKLQISHEAYKKEA